MGILGTAKRRVFRTIATNRTALPVRALHKAATFIDDAVNNRGSEFHENGEAEVLKRLGPADLKTVFDVGANVGEYTKASLKAFPNATIHAFEVAPETAQEFADNLAPDIEHDRVKLMTYGLSDVPGTLDMYYYPENNQLTSYSKRHPEYQSVKFTANISTLDAYCEEAGIDAIDFLKIDIEGHEFKVIQGGANLFAKGGVAALQFEFGAFNTGSKFIVRDYYNLLDDYWIGKVFPRHVDFRPYSWTMEEFSFCNYVAVHKSRPDLRDLLA
ncbi:MAG: FkbM family methyltransferase [Pseudomonadota bacterium]